ncbi:MAG: hypothetical protein MJZ83_04275 [Bacteroidaceae bacterium]|nr:hypothetical protein [Bacteroidaceae bacterium]
MKTEEVNKLIDKYLEGLTSAQEEKRLALELQREDAPEEWKVISMMLGELTLGEALYDQTLEQRSSRRKFLRLSWTAAASVALLVGWGIHSYVNQYDQDVAVMYVNGQKITDEKQVMAQSTAVVSEIFNLSEAPGDLVELFNME